MTVGEPIETVGDVLSRVSALTKPEMTTEVESYGLQVHSSWTKEEIMENFEQFLIEGAEGSDVEEPDVVEPSTDVPPPSTTTYAEPPSSSPEEIIPTPAPGPGVTLPSTAGDVRIMESPSRRGGWGRTGGAYAP